VARKQPIEKEPGVAHAARFFEACDRLEAFIVHVFGPAAAVANAVQTDVRRHPEQQARRIPRAEPRTMLDHKQEHILARVERLVVVAEQTAAAPQHYRPVAAAERADVQLVFHATGITPARLKSVTAWSTTTDPFRSADDLPHAMGFLVT
jgi:hypothetical protein